MLRFLILLEYRRAVIVDHSERISIEGVQALMYFPVFLPSFPTNGSHIFEDVQRELVRCSNLIRRERRIGEGYGIKAVKCSRLGD